MAEENSGSPLFRQPWVYEYIYPEAGSDSAQACENILNRFLPESGVTALEVGCGVGRVISHLAALGNDVCGIDASQPMIDYAGVLHPDMRVQVADMRTFDLGEQFDAVICVGSTFTSNLTNEEVHASLRNFRKHCRSGGVLVLGMINASRFLGFENFNERTEVRVDEGEFHASAFSRHILDRRRQSFRRVRTWKIDGQRDPVIDDAEFRLFFPVEIEEYLSQHGFSVLGIWDNSDLRETDLSDRRLYIAALAR
jgi:SAM-dependent methyltransferase